MDRRAWISSSRDEFEAVKAMASAARDENDALKARLDALEAKRQATAKRAPKKPRPSRTIACTFHSFALPCVACWTGADSGATMTDWTNAEYELERDATPRSICSKPISPRTAGPMSATRTKIVATSKGSWTEYELRAIWRAEDDSVLQFLAFPRRARARGTARRIYETLGLVNEQLWIGHFELWSASGILLYRHAAMIERGRGDADARRGRDAGRKRDGRMRAFLPRLPVRAVGRQDAPEAIAAALIETKGEA